MKPESFDQIFRDKLLHAESKVPDHLWQHIDAGLQSSRKSNRWLLLLLLPLAFAGYIIGNVGTHEPEKTYESTQDILNSPPYSDEQIIGVAYSDQSDRVAPQVNISDLSSSSLSNVHDNTLGEFKLLSQTGKEVQSFDQNLPFISIDTIHGQNNLRQGNKYSERFNQPFTSIETLETLRLFRESPKIDICPAFTVENSGIRPFLEFTIRAGMPIRELHASNSEWESYRNLRDGSEKPRISLDLQALIGIDIGRHLEVKTGIGLNQIRESFQYIDETASRTITSIITDTVVTGGVVIINHDTSIVTEYGQRIKRTNNALTRLDIPILAGFRFSLKNHQFMIGGGVAINLFFWQKGSILNPDGDIVSINSNTSDSKSIFATKTGLDVLTNLGYEIDLSGINSLRLTASYRWPLKDVTTPDYPIKQRYSQFNLGLSLKHKL